MFTKSLHLKTVFKMLGLFVVLGFLICASKFNEITPLSQEHIVTTTEHIDDTSTYSYCIDGKVNSSGTQTYKYINIPEPFIFHTANRSKSSAHCTVFHHSHTNKISLYLKNTVLLI